MLRYLNSPALSFPRKIESIRHAVMLVGTRLLSNWASLAMMESIEDKPREVMVTAMVRAHGDRIRLLQRILAGEEAADVDEGVGGKRQRDDEADDERARVKKAGRTWGRQRRIQFPGPAGGRACVRITLRSVEHLRRVGPWSSPRR